MPNAAVLPTFVLYGVDQDVAVRQYDPNYDPKDPKAQFPGHALFAFPRSKQARLKQILDLYAPPTGIADGSEQRCRDLAAERIRIAFTEGGWQAGPAYVVGRKIDEEGNWIPPQPGVTPQDEFAFSFHLQKRNTEGVWENFRMILPAREGTFLEARALVHVQKAD